MTFSPRDHLIKLPGRKGGPPIDYLPVVKRVCWLRDEHPEADIAIHVIELTDARAVMHVRVSIPERGSAEAIGSELKVAFSDYIEKAGTVALGRALAILGYGIDFADEFDEAKPEADKKDYEINQANTIAESTKGRPTAKDMREKAQQRGAGELVAMPDKPGEIVAWFNDAVAAEPARTWDAETHAAAAKKLAIALKEAGIGDQQRRLVYLALTGKEHGGDMTPQQMVALSRTLTKPQQLLALARWYTERNSQRDPAEGG